MAKHMRTGKHGSIRRFAALGVAAGVFLAGCGGDEEGGEIEASDQEDSGEEAGPQVTLQLATYTGPQAADTLAYQQWADRVSDLTGGSVTVEIFGQGSLLAAPDILSGIAAGRADMGGTSYIYHPSELPLSHVVNIPYQTTHMPAEALAFKDLYENSDAYREEFDGQGVHLLFNWIVGPPLFGCTEPVESLADLEGRDMRVGGLVAQAFEPVGVNIVSIPAPDIREGMERGLLDCWAGIPLDVVPDFGLEEVTPYIYDSGYQNYGTFHLIVNGGVWDSLTDDQQMAMEQASEEVLSELASITDQAYGPACEAINASDAELAVLGENLQNEWRDLVGDDVVDAYYDLTAAAGAPGEEFFAEYQDAVDRYEQELPEYESAILRCVEGRL